MLAASPFWGNAWEVLSPLTSVFMITVHISFLGAMGLGVWFFFWPNNSKILEACMNNDYDNRKLSRAAGLLFFCAALSLIQFYVEAFTDLQIPLILGALPFILMVIIFLVLDKTGKLKVK